MTDSDGVHRVDEEPADEPDYASDGSDTRDPSRGSGAERLRTLLEQNMPEALKDKSEHLARIASWANGGVPQPLVVLSADIRRSTFLMKEAVYPFEFAGAIGQFVAAARSIVHLNRGWFDKFTGDGFLAFWICDAELLPDRSYEGMYRALRAANMLIEGFERFSMPRLRANSQNFPSGLGLSVGIDGGQGQFVEIADSLTVLGTPVVGAVRMVNAAGPNEVLLNNYLGEWLAGDIVPSNTRSTTSCVR